MADASLQQTKSPARRYRGRRPGKTGGQKAYASENDAGITESPHYQSMPETPGKATPGNLDSPHPGSKQKPRNKPKNKNQVASPDSPRAAHNTPTPQRSTSSKSISAAAAFAGATFHASPAPSALPIPSFLSRATNDSPISKGPRNLVQEPSPPATDTEVPTPHRPTATGNQHESPLDFMFRAHKAETERRRRESFHEQPPRKPRTTSPPSQSPFELSSSPKAPHSLQTRYTKQQYGGIGASELDGTPGRPMGPAFSTPYHERIKAARGNPSAPIPEHSPHSQTAPSEDPTEALKKFLFNGNILTQPGSPSSSAPSAPHAAMNSSQSGPTATQPVNRTNNIQAMENDLRRILKLDMASDKPSVERRLF